MNVSFYSSKTSAQHGHKKSDSITSNSSSGAGSHFYCDINNSTLRYVSAYCISIRAGNWFWNGVNVELGGQIYFYIAMIHDEWGI